MIARQRPLNVFIVDDSPIVVERLSAMLTELCWVKVMGTSTSADEAIVALDTSKPDVMILDIHLAGGTGLDVLHHIHESASAVTVIVLTNYPDSQHRQWCLEAGADFFFDKSCEFERIPQVLQSLLPN
jgi:DNA-binding NarL/FixJ family response regulator